jgi:CBS domain-containing protein
MKIKDVMGTHPQSWSHISWAAVARLSDMKHVLTFGVTDRDICMAAYFQGMPLSGIQVSTAMSRQLIVCSSDDDLSAAERIMREKKVRRLPVLNKQGRLVGLLSISDIARRADEEYAGGAAHRYVSDAEVARLAAAVSESRRTSRLA